MAKAPEKKKPTSYSVLAAARQLIEGEKITLKELAHRMGMPPTSLGAMLAPDYKNMTLDRLDALRDVVKEIRSGG